MSIIRNHLWLLIPWKKRFITKDWNTFILSSNNIIFILHLSYFYFTFILHLEYIIVLCIQNTRAYSYGKRAQFRCETMYFLLNIQVQIEWHVMRMFELVLRLHARRFHIAYVKRMEFVNRLFWKQKKHTWWEKWFIIEHNSMTNA